jgi:hypothetical protein
MIYTKYNLTTVFQDTLLIMKYISLSVVGIQVKIGQHYRKKFLDCWINYGSTLSGEYIDYLQDEKICLQPNDTGFIAVEEADTGRTTFLPKILLIVFGICLLLINICAYCALYNQRRKLRAQELFIRNFYSEAEIANSKAVYVEQSTGRHEPENLTANKEMLQSNCEGQHGGERNGTAEDMKRNYSESSHWKISRQCSASTMDTNTKVRRWIEYELNERSLPELRSLNPTPFERADQKNVSIRQGTSKIHLPADDPSQVLVIPIIHQEQNPSCSTTCKQISTIHSVPRKVAKKVSVAVDATPSARVASMLCRHVKDISGDASNQTAHGTLYPKEAVPLAPECCDVNSTLVSAVVSEGEPSNCRHFEYFRFEKNAISQANPLVTDVKNVSSHSRGLTHNNTSKVEPSDMTNKTVNETPMEICPKKVKLRGTKKDVGINTNPVESVLERMENTKCVTSKDTAAKANEILPVVNSLKNSYRRNENEVLFSEQNVVKEHEKQKSCRKGVILTGTVTRRRSSVPFHMHRRPSRLRQSAITKRKNSGNKSTGLSRRGNPPTVGSPKPNTAAPLGILQDSFEVTSPRAALPTDATKVSPAGHPSTLVLLHQEPNNTHSSEVIVEKRTVDKQNQARQELPSAPLSPTKLRATEAETEKLPLPKAAFCKKRSPAKVSVGTSTNSLIPSEGKKVE